MGGMVALELMKIAPLRVKGLALLDTNARPDSFGRKARRSLANLVLGMGVDFRRQAERSVVSLVHPSTPADVRAELLEMSVRVGAEAYVRQNCAVSARGDQRGSLREIAVPTAVIVGENDRLTPVALSEEICAMVPGAALHVIPACGHLPSIEKPEATAALLTELMERRVA